MNIDPLDVYDAILHEVALARAEAAPSTPRTRAMVSALRTEMKGLLESAPREPRDDSAHNPKR